MVQIREHKQKHLTRQAAVTVLKGANLPVRAIVTTVLVMIVAPGKEAAP